MDTYRRMLSHCIREVRAAAVFLASVILLISLSATPANASSWYPCWLDWRGAQDWCVDDDYWSNVFYDQYGHAYEVDWAAEDAWLLHNGTWFPMDMWFSM